MENRKYVILNFKKILLPLLMKQRKDTNLIWIHNINIIINAELTNKLT